MLIEEALTEIGLSTLGPATRVAKAIRLIEAHPPEGAVLDVNLAGEKVYPVADILAALGIPFVFLTGYGDTQKPQDANAWLVSIQTILSRVR